ncbi:MAG: AAA family ATPase [Gemmataceae bacterium]|nr:AAA family ATPase [Gemmataceae bacterium]
MPDRLVPEPIRDAQISPPFPEAVPASPPGPEPAPSADGLPADVGLEDLRRTAKAPVAWLWHGYLAPGSVTLLTSQWKSGKTTLVAVLLARLKTGGQLAGRPLAAGKAVVVSEESAQQWEQRSRKLDFGTHTRWLCRPFRGKPRLPQWLALLERLAALHRRHGLALVVFDPLAFFLPGRDESHAGTMPEALLPLQQLTSRGVSVLLLHHPAKRVSTAGMAARGSGALSGFVDILIEMDRDRRAADDDRRRWLRAYSRYEETPRQLVSELNAEGTDYGAVSDVRAEAFSASWQRLRMVLEDANGKLTRREILAEWPEDFDKPNPATVWEWLQRAVAQGLVSQEGTGRKNDPYRYWIPGREQTWHYGPPWMRKFPELQAIARFRDELLRGLEEGLGGQPGSPP